MTVLILLSVNESSFLRLFENCNSLSFSEFNSADVHSTQVIESFKFSSSSTCDKYKYFKIIAL